MHALITEATRSSCGLRPSAWTGDHAAGLRSFDTDDLFYPAPSIRKEMRNGETNEIAATCELTGVHLDRRLRKAFEFGMDIRSAASRLLERQVA